MELYFQSGIDTPSILDWQIQEYKNKKLKIQFHFNNTKYISQYTYIDGITIDQELPPQNLNSSGLQILESSLIAAKTIITVTVVSNFALSIILSISMRQLWKLVNTLQLITYIPMLSVALPQNAMICFNSLIQISNLDLIPKETLSKMFKLTPYQDTDNGARVNDNLDDQLFISFFQLACTAFIVTTPFLLLQFLRNNAKKLNRSVTISQYGALYLGLNPEKYMIVYWIFIYLMRRLMFAVSIVFMKNSSTTQLAQILKKFLEDRKKKNSELIKYSQIVDKIFNEEIRQKMYSTDNSMMTSTMTNTEILNDIQIEDITNQKAYIQYRTKVEKRKKPRNKKQLGSVQLKNKYLSENDEFDYEQEQYIDTFYNIYQKQKDYQSNNQLFKNDEPKTQAQLIEEFRKCFEKFLEKKTHQKRLKIPWNGNVTKFLESTFKIIYENEPLEKTDQNRQNFEYFIKCVRKIFIKETSLVYETRRKESKMLYNSQLYKVVMNRILSLVKLFLSEEELNQENMDKYRTLVIQTLKCSLVLRQLNYVLRNCLCQINQDSPLILKQIIRTEYMLALPENQSDSKWDLSKNELLSIKNQLINEVYNIPRFFEKANFDINSLSMINEISTAIILNCRNIMRNDGKFVNQTYVILSLLSKNLLKGYLEFTQRLKEQDKSAYWGQNVEIINEANIRIRQADIINKQIGNIKYEEYFTVGESEYTKIKRSKQLEMIHLSQKIHDQVLQILEVLDENLQKIEVDGENDLKVERILNELHRDKELDDALSETNRSTISYYEKKFEKQIFQVFENNIEERLNLDSLKQSSRRQRLNDLTSFSLIDKSSLSFQMESVYNEIMELVKDPILLQKSFIEKWELPKYLHNYLIGSLRKIRAFNFESSLCEIIDKYISYLIEDLYESSKKMMKLKQAFGVCFDRLDVKANKDSNLINNEEFKQNFESFKLTFRKLNDKVNEYIVGQVKDLLQRKEENDQIKLQVKRFLNDLSARRSLKKMISIVNDDMLFTSYKRIDQFQAIIESQFQTYFKLNKETLKTSLYGLTGAGLQFKGSTIKILVRMSNVVKTIKPLFEQIKYSDEKSPFQLSSDTNNVFRVVHSDNERCLYLKVFKNEIAQKYDNLVFKIKFEHMNVRKEFKLANLIQRYLNFDKNRVRRIAAPFIALLKMNQLVGEKEGYPSSITYLMMFINYCQQLYILPNLTKYEKENDEIFQKFQTTEQLTEREKNFLNKIIVEKTLSNLDAGSNDLLSSSKNLESKVKVSYYFNENKDGLTKQLLEYKHLVGMGVMESDKLFILFLKHLAVSLPSRNTKYNIASGGLQKKRLHKNQYINVRNPFIKMINQGSILKDPFKFNKIIYKVKEFIRFIHEGQFDHYILHIATQIRDEGSNPDDFLESDTE
ncbi:UNKNOWN [Stylonychia lemnae]|uniref:Transmembrane protein n=1 Tax=Stylonychia lemnae TaxID=5949 RepID=A0A078B5W8_STYLE|nr:UNKNOWN [Stylonychia lemnae]|eukprot:CDW88878.1 UNKNOWN [Stylonychia lemnae]